MIHVKTKFSKSLFIYEKFNQIHKLSQKCRLTQQKQFHTDKKTTIAGPWNVLFFGTDEFALESLTKLQHE